MSEYTQWVLLVLVDRPTQLMYIGISICWVGGGNPCGVADFCLSGVYCHKKQARSDFFSKCPCHVHKDCLEAQNGTKNWVKPLKKLFFFKPYSPLAQISRNVAATNREKMSLAWIVAATNEDKSGDDFGVECTLRSSVLKWCFHRS